MDRLDCPECGEPVEIIELSRHLIGPIKCPHCGMELELDYELSIDDDSGEIYYYWLKPKGA